MMGSSWWQGTRRVKSDGLVQLFCINVKSRKCADDAIAVCLHAFIVHRARILARKDQEMGGEIDRCFLFFGHLHFYHR